MTIHKQLRPQHYLVLVVLIVLIRIWIRYDQEFIPTSLLRMIAFTGLVLSGLTGFFFLVRPDRPIMLAGYLALLLTPTAIILSLVQHLLIEHDFSLYYKQMFMIWSIVLAVPFAVAGIYILLRKLLSAETGDSEA